MAVSSYGVSRSRGLLRNLCVAASCLLVLPAASVYGGDRPAAAISLSTYFERNKNLVAGPGAMQLDSGAITGSASQVTGSWSSSTSVPAMFRRGVHYQSAQIAPVGGGINATSKTHRVGWQYSFLTAPPAGIHAYLCNYARCVGLTSVSGSGFSNFVFAFVIDGRGSLTPALQGSASQVLVSYK
ncbi:flagellar protein FlhE [Collimonas sp. OK607]|uniref:flagellar protein FlhE n=1 Tax=Collimonas sp. OK607 TaxID=1798194 RepID=UPI0008EFEB59|nr:flagellar protein FlhE [Collimonas sp. OK607]SFB22139.1 flagellar protein FlhE [Collimonas sp. OK607]